MEEQIPASQVPEQQPVEAPPSFQVPGQGTPQIPAYITPQQLEEMKARARELAFQQTIAQQAALQQAAPQAQPKVVYVRRNLTVAELALILLLSCGLVTAFQAGWNFTSNILPRLEIKVK